MFDGGENLHAAERIASLLSDNGVQAVVIGAVALAAHRYVRHTEDFDLGVDADLPKMRLLAAVLRNENFSVELHEPDGDDPLGGVIDVSGVIVSVDWMRCFRNWIEAPHEDLPCGQGFPPIKQPPPHPWAAAAGFC